VKEEYSYLIHIFPRCDIILVKDKWSTPVAVGKELSMSSDNKDNKRYNVQIYQ